jgi:hypothetical protein
MKSDGLTSATQQQMERQCMSTVSKICPACKKEFVVKFKKRAQVHCSKSCAWVATKGPAFNALIARNTIKQRADAMRGRGTADWYIKLNGKHAHRVVAEQMLGRCLLPGEIVHHVDGDKRNNDPRNLVVMTQSEHMKEHGLGIKGMALHWKPWLHRKSKSIGG